jgi:hypothetical protein
MKIAERHNLTLVKELFSDGDFQLNLLEDEDNNLFVSCNTSKPNGIVYFGTTCNLLCEFITKKIALQDLFDKSPSRFVEIVGKYKRAIYSRNDLEIILTNGTKWADQLSEEGFIEIWGC